MGLNWLTSIRLNPEFDGGSKRLSPYMLLSVFLESVISKDYQMVGRIDLTIVDFILGLYKMRKWLHGLTFKKTRPQVGTPRIIELILLQNLCISQCSNRKSLLGEFSQTGAYDGHFDKVWAKLKETGM